MASEVRSKPGLTHYAGDEATSRTVDSAGYFDQAMLGYRASWSGSRRGRIRAGRLSGDRCEAQSALVSGLSLHPVRRPDRAVLLVIQGRDDPESAGAGTIRLFTEVSEPAQGFESPRFICSVAVPLTTRLVEEKLLSALLGNSVTSELAWNFMRSSMAPLATGSVEDWPASKSTAVLIDQYLLSMADLILRLLCEELPPALIDHDPVRTRADAIIMARSDDPELSPKRLADELDISLRSLNRSYAAVGGVAHALRRRRLEVAALRLCIARQFSVAEVARRSGFPTVGTFHRAFLTVYGMTPLRYRLREGDTSSNNPMDG